MHDQELLDLPVSNERLKGSKVLQDGLRAPRGSAQDEDLAWLEAEELLGVRARVAACHDDSRGHRDVECGHLGEKGARLEGGEGSFVPREEVCDCRAGHDDRRGV